MIPAVARSRRRSQAGRAAVLLGLLASQAAAGPFDGAWSPDPAQCAVEDDVGRIIVSDRELRMWEETCRLGPPTPALSPAGAVIHDARCQGLDYTWSGRIVLMLGADGRLAVIDDEGRPTFYHRCG